MSRAAGPRTWNRWRTKSSPTMEIDDVRRQRGSGAAAQLLELRQHQPTDLGDHPGADGEVSASQAEDDQRGRDGNNPRDDPRQHDRQHGLKARHQGEGEQRIGSDADEGLLPDGNQASAAGEQIP